MDNGANLPIVLDEFDRHEFIQAELINICGK